LLRHWGERGNGKAKTKKYTNKPPSTLSLAGKGAQWAYAQVSPHENAALRALRKK